MKTTNLTIILALLLTASSRLWAEETGASQVYYIKAPRFAGALVEKWISDYQKIDPQLTLRTATGSQQADLTMAITDNHEQQDAATRTVYFGQYAILPVTARQSLAAKYFSKHRQSRKRLKELFFIVDEFDNSVERDKEKRALVVYTGSSQLSVTAPLADYFGLPAANLKGKRISGDDAYLNMAVNRDEEGVTFNALSNVFNLQSRRLLDNLSLVPLDVKKDKAALLTDEADLDALITLLEQDEVEGIPVEPVGLKFPTTADERLLRFLSWVVARSGELNHQYGLLNLSNKSLAKEGDKLNLNLTAQK